MTNAARPFSATLRNLRLFEAVAVDVEGVELDVVAEPDRVDLKGSVGLDGGEATQGLGGQEGEFGLGERHGHTSVRFMADRGLLWLAGLPRIWRICEV